MTNRDACWRVQTAASAQMACRNPEHRATWAVTIRNGNYSAFNGYHFTPSEYSEIKCRTGGARWRSRADYVAGLPNAD